MTRLSALARAALWAVAALLLLALYAPLALAVFFSFFELRNNAVQWDRFSLDAYAALARDRGVLEALANTAIVGGAAAAAALVLGTLLAFHYHGSRGRARELLQLVVFLPFLMPPILTGLSLLTFFRELGIERSLATVVVAHTVFVLALAYRTILQRLQSLRPSLVEASLDLGASPGQTFRYVLLPHLLPALAAAAVLCFALSFDETLITLLVTGTRSTLPLRLWSMMRLGFTPDINALVALVLAATTALGLLVSGYFLRPRGGAESDA